MLYIFVFVYALLFDFITFKYVQCTAKHIRYGSVSSVVACWM